MKVIANALSINMLPKMDEGDELNIKVKKIAEPSAEEKEKMHSIIGHPSTAAVVGVPCNRETFVLSPDTELVVAQYIGPRLDEGVTELPDGASLVYFNVSLGA